MITLIPMCSATICHIDANFKDIKVFYLSKDWRRICVLWWFMLLCLTEIKWRVSDSVVLHHAPSDDLLAEGEGEGVCCCSDRVLCLHMGHIFCINVIDGHHPVSDPDTSLSCLPAWGQLDKRKHGDRNQTEVRGAWGQEMTVMWMKTWGAGPGAPLLAINSGR